MRYKILCLFCLLSVAPALFGQADTKQKQAKARRQKDDQLARQLKEAQSEVFKTIDGTNLKLYVFTPESHSREDKRPAIVFFFGGGWTNGSPGQFAPQCRYLASRGMVAITAEYRVKSRHNVVVPQCVADAKSAIRWVRSHAGQLGVDPDRIASGGGSAGGHLGGAVGVIDGLDEPNEDLSISSRPNAMVLFNPVMATAPVDGLSREYTARMAERKEQFGGDAEAVSPYHHMKAGQPPMIMFFGSADGLKESAILFDRAYRELGNRCELKFWEGPGHGFFNFGRDDNKYFIETCREMDRFLGSLGYLEGEPTIDDFVKQLD